MKKSVRILALVLVAVMLCVAFAGCGKKLKGKYSNAEGMLASGATYEFKGSNVTITVKLLGAVVATVEGTYSIEDDQITFEFGEEEDDVKEYNGTFTFAETEKGIKIGMFEYEKID